MIQSNREALLGASSGKAAEPRSLTVVDLLAIVAGLAVASSVCPLSVAVPLRLGLPIGIAAIFWWVLARSAGVSTAVLVRQASYRRPARPAEWLCLLMSINLVQFPNLDRLVNTYFSPAMISGSFGHCRWVIAGYTSVAILAGVVALSFLGRSLPHWLRTVIAAGSLVLFLWGPAHVFSLEVDSLLSSTSQTAPGGIDRNTAAARRQIGVDWLEVAAWRHLGSVPAGVVYGVPTVTLIAGSWRRERRPRIWTEAIGAAIAAFIGLSLLAHHYVGTSRWPPDGINAARIIAPLWILGLSILSTWAGLLFRPWWDRCMNDSPTTDPGIHEIVNRVRPVFVDPEEATGEIAR